MSVSSMKTMAEVMADIDEDDLSYGSFHQSDEDSGSHGVLSDMESPPHSPKMLKRKQQPSEKIFLKKQKIENANLYGQPTVEEINQLNETKNLHHSNLFRMQVQELLGEVKIKDKYIQYFNVWLEKFSNFLVNCKPRQKKPSDNDLAWLTETGLQIPMVEENMIQKNITFNFVAPKEAPSVIGSFRTNTLIGPQMVVDVLVEMPSECFQKDNYMNRVYDRKKALYLCYIASKIKESNQEDFVLQFNLFKNNPQLPLLEVTPPGKFGGKLKFRIFVVPAEGTFRLSRFVPWNSNLRGTFFGEKNSDDSAPLATPNYNAKLLFDFTMKSNHAAMEKVLAGKGKLQEGLILLKVWLHQRNLDVGYTSFGGYIMSAFVVYLFRKGKLHPSMSSYQVARQTWNYLALSAWDEHDKGISLYDGPSSPNLPTLEQFSTHYPVVFIDFTGYKNICADLSVDTYKRVKAESRRAIEILNNTDVNSFHLLFMTKQPEYTQFDHILKISGAKIINRLLRNHGNRADKYNFAGFWYPQLLKMITRILHKGLSDRIQHLIPIERECKPWSVTTSPDIGDMCLRLGLILNPDRAYEVLDKGPQANEEGAEEFRQFWGEKSELRRFRDGNITETCVWASLGDKFTLKRLITCRIVEYLLKHHYSLLPSEYQYVASELDVTYKLNRLFKVDKLVDRIVDQETDAEATALNVIQSFDDLGQKLRSLDSLPLSITSVEGTSPVFRYCDPVPILPDSRITKFGISTRALNHGVIQLCVSGRWPDELPAFRATKVAFYVEIAKLLKEKYKYRSVLRFDGLTVFKDGYTFCLEISHPKEIVLLKKEITEKGIIRYKDTSESLAGEKQLIILPKVTSALHGLYQLHPSFGPAVMIAKRWLYSQLIDNALWPDECTELLIASQYLQMGAQSTICQPQTGFFRFLHLLATTDWQTEIIILNFNNEMNQQSVAALKTRFLSEREAFPLLTIITSHDGDRYDFWTQNAPILPILNRVVLLAKHALQIIDAKLMCASTTFKPSKLFTPSTEGYDLVIRLKSEHIPNSLATEFPSGFTKWCNPNFCPPISHCDPIKCAMDDLREAFSEFCMFFYNPCGGREIAVIWKPDIFSERDFKVNSMNGCAPTDINGKVIVSKSTLIEDFKITLKDLYLSIQELN